MPIAPKTRPPLTVTVITLNEAHNLPKLLASVRGWASEIVVVDSGSTDRTVEIAQAAGAAVFHNPWPGFGGQKNFAQTKATHDWILNLDADEAASIELKAEIDSALATDPTPRTYAIPRKNHYLGQWIRYGGWSPNRLARLGHRSVARWTEPEVHEALEGVAPARPLQYPILHWGFHSIHDQLETNWRYSRLGAEKLLREGRRGSLFKLVWKPLSKFLETYLIKRGFLDGLAGFIISINAAYSVFMKHAFLLEQRIRKDHT